MSSSEDNSSDLTYLSVCESIYDIDFETNGPVVSEKGHGKIYLYKYQICSGISKINYFL